MSKTLEMFMRWDSNAQRYEFKGDETLQAVPLSEEQAKKLLESLSVDPMKHKILKFLFDEAKKDPKGSWVSASSAPPSSGQAMI